MLHPRIQTQNSARFLTSVITPTPQADSRSKPERYDIDESLKENLRARWPIEDASEESARKEWIQIIFRIFGKEPQAANPQVEIMGKDYDAFLNYTLRLKELLHFMNAEMPEQKETLIDNLAQHFRTHCVHINNLDYNHAANICDAIGLFYGAMTDEASPLKSTIPEMHSSLNENTIKQSVALSILEHVQKNAPTEETSLYIPIQTHLLQCLLLRLRVLGVRTGTSADTSKLPEEITQFLGELPKLLPDTYATISLWLSYYNPKESLATYLSKKARLQIAARGTTAEFLTRLENAIIENNLNNIQTRLTKTEEAERETAPSPLQALFKVRERLSTTASVIGGGVAPTTLSNLAETGSGMELSPWPTEPPTQTPQELETQGKMIQYSQICRITPSSQATDVYNNLYELNREEAELFLKAFLRLQAMQAFDNEALKASYADATRDQEKPSFYHPQLPPILKAWKTHIGTNLELQSLIRAQQKWLAQSLNPNAIFKKLAQLVVDHLILSKDLIARGTLSENQHKTYRRLLNFDFLTPNADTEELPPGETARQNEIACLRANPQLLTDIHDIITTIIAPDRGATISPSRFDLMREFKTHRDQGTFDGNVEIGRDLITRKNRTTTFLKELFQIEQLPPPGDALGELFEQLNIDELRIKSQYKTGAALEETFTPYLEDTFKETTERIQIIRAWIQYLLNHMNFTFERHIQAQERTADVRDTDDQVRYRPAREDECQDPEVRKAGIYNLLTHLKDSLDSYAVTNSKKGKCLLALRVITYLCLSGASLTAEAFSRERLIHDPSGAHTNPIELDALLYSSNAGAIIIGALMTSGIIALAQNKLNAIKMREIISKLKNEPYHPYRTGAITISALSLFLMLATGAASIYIAYKILPPLNAQTVPNSSDDTPISQEIDKFVDIGRPLVLAAYGMIGVSAVILWRAISEGCKLGWFCCGRRARVRTIDAEFSENDTGALLFATPSNTPATRDRSAEHLLGSSRHTSYGTTLHFGSGIVEERRGGTSAATAPRGKAISSEEPSI